MPIVSIPSGKFEVIYPNGVKLKISSPDLKTLAGLMRLY